MIEAIRALLDPLWPALLAASAVGLPLGALGWRAEPAGFWGRVGLILLVVGLAGACALAISGRVSGRAGLALELGLAVLVCYLLGCVVGAVVRAAWMGIARRGAPAT